MRSIWRETKLATLILKTGLMLLDDFVTNYADYMPKLLVEKRRPCVRMQLYHTLS